MGSTTPFQRAFEALTGHRPFPWQANLYEQFVASDIPESCRLPTGVGKTNVIAVWLLALASGANVPRRMVYVVNRRTVVDQTTIEVERYRASLKEAGLDGPLRALCALPVPVGEPPLAISTLRGQFADNRQWSADPSRPAVICGTVDMIGSRLLFSGYGVGFKAKPLHAGFLGQDALLVHDEAHLEPAFQRLIDSIRDEQRRCHDFAPFHVMELTATTRNETESNGAALKLTTDDLQHPVVKQRIEAAKQLVLHEVAEDKQAAEKIAELALEHKDSRAAVLVFVRILDDVERVCDRLTSKKGGVPKDNVQKLTGTMRGLERDRLAKCDPVFMRFLPNKSRNSEVNPAEGTVYLVCTSAGEVGVDISAEHMVCDLSTFESMAQRFGRVNRYGLHDDTWIDVVHPAEFDEKDKLSPARQLTLTLLQRLEGNASPSNLDKLDPRDRANAFAPKPAIPDSTDILFDAWALTSIRGAMPGRPPVEPYLHGIAEWEPPETYVAWRREVEIITEGLREEHPPADLLDEYPLKPHELLHDRSERVFKHLQAIAARCPDRRRLPRLTSRGHIEATPTSTSSPRPRSLPRLTSRGHIEARC